MEQRSAALRAWGFLNFQPLAHAVALIGGVLADFVIILLLVVLGLFLDFVVYRGQPPNAPPADTRDWLSEKVGPDAAAVYDQYVQGKRSDLGILAPLLRHAQPPVIEQPLSWLAAWDPWLWNYARPGTANVQYLGALAVHALCLAALWATLLWLMHRAAAAAAIEASKRLRRAAFHHTFRVGAAAARPGGSNEAAGTFTRHIETIHEALYAWLTVTVREAVCILLLAVLAVAISPWLALVFAIVVALAWLVGTQIASYFGGREARAARHAAGQLVLLQESLLLVRLVKAYVMELFHQGRLERQLAGYLRAQKQRAAADAWRHSLIPFLTVLALVALLFVAGLLSADGQLGAVRALFLAVVLVTLAFAVYHWLGHWQVLRRGNASASALFKFLDRPREVTQEVGAELLPPLGHHLEFDNVSLREPGSGRPLLQGISLTIEAGQRVALVGPNDAEKYALVYLIPRFLDPNSGEIRIDEHNLRWVTLDSLRRQIGLVLQQNLVFNETVANNISCGDTSFKLPQIMEAAKLAHAHQFIQKLPKGYDTPIGELGHSLNVGEQFRIALARAILRNPALFIIEEPPASYLDESTRDLLDDTFGRVLPGRTALFLPHRLTTLFACNEVVLLNRGRIEARGPHQELVEQSPLYHHLHYVEFNDFVGALP
jgi:ATP-binding cassette subfamily B protein